MTAGENIRRARNKLGLSPAAFAKLVGVTRPTVENWEKGTHHPTDKHIPRLCRATGLPKEAFNKFQGGVTEPRIGEKLVRLPLLDWADLRHITAGKIKMSALRKPKQEVEVDPEHSPESFVLRVADASMEPRFSMGEKIVVDPTAAVRNKDIVVARLPDGTHVLREYLDLDDGAYMLVPKNAKKHKVITVNAEYAVELIGVVVEHHQRMKR